MILYWGGKAERLLGLVGHLVWSNWWPPGSMIDPVSKSKMGSDRGRHLTLNSSLCVKHTIHTYTDTHTAYTNTHIYINIYYKYFCENTCREHVEIHVRICGWLQNTLRYLCKNACGMSLRIRHRTACGDPYWDPMSTHVEICFPWDHHCESDHEGTMW